MHMWYLSFFSTHTNFSTQKVLKRMGISVYSPPSVSQGKVCKTWEGISLQFCKPIKVSNKPDLSLTRLSKHLFPHFLRILPNRQSQLLLACICWRLEMMFWECIIGNVGFRLLLHTRKVTKPNWNSDSHLSTSSLTKTNIRAGSLVKRKEEMIHF